MRPIQISNDVVSIGELKVQASRLLRRINENRRPIVITQHGKPAAVMLTTEDYDRLAEHVRFIDAVQEGLSDSEQGNLVDDAGLDRHLDAVLGKRKKK